MKLKLCEYGQHECNWENEKIVDFDSYEEAVRDFAEKYCWYDHDGGPYDEGKIAVYVRDMEINITIKYEIMIRVSHQYIIKKL